MSTRVVLCAPHLVSRADPLLHHAQLTRIAVVHTQSQAIGTSSSVSSSTGSIDSISSSSTTQSPTSSFLSSPSLSPDTIQGCFTAAFSIAKYYGEEALLCSEFCAGNTACLPYVLNGQHDSYILLTASTRDAFEETVSLETLFEPLFDTIAESHAQKSEREANQYCRLRNLFRTLQ